MGLGATSTQPTAPSKPSESPKCLTTTAHWPYSHTPPHAHRTANGECYPPFFSVNTRARSSPLCSWCLLVDPQTPFQKHCLLRLRHRAALALALASTVLVHIDGDPEHVLELEIGR